MTPLFPRPFSVTPVIGAPGGPAASQQPAGRTPTVFKNVTLQSVSGYAGWPIWEPTRGKRFRLMGLHLLSDTTARYNWWLRDGESGNPLLTLQTPAGVPEDVNFGPSGILSGAPGRPLVLYNNSTHAWKGLITGIVWGTEE